MNYELSASTFAPTAKVHLQRGEKLRIEPGAMVYQLGDIELEGHMNTNGKKGLGGALSALGRSVTSGESFFISTATARSNEAMIAIAPAVPGKIFALDVGADDYVTKPFNPVTLGAKVKALIRRSRNGLPGADSLITAGPFTYNTSTLRFYKNGVEILLSAKENAMMKLFIDNVNRIFSKDMLYDLLWGEAIIDENAIMVYVNRLRAKIEEDPARPAYIQTVRGLGYRFVV